MRQEKILYVNKQPYIMSDSLFPLQQIRDAYPDLGIISEDTFRLNAIADSFRDQHSENIVPLLICACEGMPFISYSITHYLREKTDEEAMLDLLKLNGMLPAAKAFIASSSEGRHAIISSTLRPELYTQQVLIETVAESISDMIASANYVARFFGS
jgi:hypothetical protein